MTRTIVTIAAAVVSLGLAAGLAAAGRQASKKAYLLAQVEVSNAEQYQKYAAVAPDVVAKYGGRYLARGGRTVTLEGPPAKPRVVVIEFPSLEQAQAFYNSPEYVATRKLREGAAEGQFVVVEGL